MCCVCAICIIDVAELKRAICNRQMLPCKAAKDLLPFHVAAWNEAFRVNPRHITQWDCVVPITRLISRRTRARADAMPFDCAIAKAARVTRGRSGRQHIKSSHISASTVITSPTWLKLECNL